jgi:predicted metal-dependent HD superfamily phosphohydrolase
MSTLRAVAHLILCTINHELTFPLDFEIDNCLRDIVHTTPQSATLAPLFLDLDLSILGSDEKTYKTYARQIREEYRQYSDKEYSAGRTKVLRHFVERERLFFTEHFLGKYEQKARANIAAEIDSLFIDEEYETERTNYDGTQL